MNLDVTFGFQVVEISSLVSVLFRERFNHPYISFFHLQENGFSVYNLNSWVNMSDRELLLKWNSSYSSPVCLLPALQTATVMVLLQG